MNYRNLLVAVLLIAAFSSCSAVYKTGQTPDDIYYSAGKPRPVADEYVDVKKYQGNNFQTYDEYQDSYRDDRFLRMSVGNPYYMDAYDAYSGFDWRYNAYNGFGMGFYGMSSPWNNYYAWNNFYNPYYGFSNFYYGGGLHMGGAHVAMITPVSRPVSFNANSYGSGSRPSRSYLGGNYNNSNQRYNYYNSNTNRNSYNNNNNNYNNRSTNNSYTPSNSNSNSAPSRSYTPSSSGSSSSGSVSRPGRGGR